MNANEKKEIDEKILDLARKAAEKDKGTLKGEGYIVFSTLEEALEHKRKRLEEQRKRIEERKRLKKAKEKAEESEENESDNHHLRMLLRGLLKRFRKRQIP